MASSSASDELAILMEIVGCDDAEGARLLECAGGSAQRAIDLYYGRADAQAKAPRWDTQHDFHFGRADTQAGAPRWDTQRVIDQHEVALGGEARCAKIRAKYRLDDIEPDDEAKKLCDYMYKLCSNNCSKKLKQLLESDAYKRAVARNPASHLLSFYTPCSGHGVDDSDEWPLFDCVEFSAYDCAELLLCSGSPVDAPAVLGGDAPLHHSDEMSMLESPLIFAAECGDYQMVELLLRHGANPFFPDPRGGMTARETAEFCGDKCWDDDPQYDHLDPQCFFRCQELLKDVEDAYLASQFDGQGRLWARLCHCPHHLLQTSRTQYCGKWPPNDRQEVGFEPELPIEPSIMEIPYLSAPIQAAAAAERAQKLCIAINTTSQLAEPAPASSMPSEKALGKRKATTAMGPPLPPPPPGRSPCRSPYF